MPQVVVGLGNPGPAYRQTRHNIGQAVVDRLAERLHGRFRRRGSAQVAEVRWRGEALFLAKPQTFMNTVGPGVRRTLRLLDLDPNALIVVQDDIDLPFGRVRVRQKGGHGGHHGVRSLIETLGTATFRRVKVGVGRPTRRDEVADWVLTEFCPAEQDALPAVLERAADAVLELAAAGAAS